jgi:hypothetical protein
VAADSVETATANTVEATAVETTTAMATTAMATTAMATSTVATSTTATSGLCGQWRHHSHRRREQDCADHHSGVCHEYLPRAMNVAMQRDAAE